MLRQVSARLVLALMLMTLPASASSSPPADCPLQPDIIAHADFLLVDPKIEQRFWRDRVSTDAGYLMIRYGGLDQRSGDQVIEMLRQRRVRPERIGDLRLAFAPPDRRVGLIEDFQEGSSVPPGGFSFFRAMVIDAREDWLFADMARRARTPGADQRMVAAFQMRLARSLSDLADRDKLAIALKAEEQGLWTLARELLAQLPDPRDWLALVRRAPNAPRDQAALTQWFTPLWRGTHSFRPRSFAPDVMPPELQAVADAIDRQRGPHTPAVDVLIELYGRAPATQVLLTVFNQTGNIRIGSEIGVPLLGEVRSGDLDPARHADRLQARILRGLVQVLGKVEAERQLTSFSATALMPTHEPALAPLERAAAREALAGFVAGRTEQPPPRPEVVSATFDWAGWVHVARAIRGSEQVHDSYRGIQADLLHAAGRHQEAVDMLRQVTPVDDARRRSHRMMLSLDGQCAGLLADTLLLGDPLYRFPPR
ncbi:hypothetical protein [Phreatobacter sp.]|uniref:hypothetical protein n=1 Tax=Phreatobacter sp. TaxID=1966341 RepID=UPI003F6EE791